MSPNPAARSFPSPSNTAPAMGRKRTRNLDLPPHMARKGERYYYVCNGKPRVWIPLGTDRARALRLWAEHEAGPQVGLSVGDLVQRYIDRQSDDLAPGSIKQYRSFQRAIAQAFPIPAGQLTAQHVAIWRDLPKQRARKGYVTGCIAVLRSAFLLGAEQGLCVPLVVRGWTMAPRDRYLTDEEYIAIRERAPEWLQIAMDLGYLTAARRSDLLALRWDALTGTHLTMRQQKTGQRMSFTITTDMSSVLARAKQRRVLGLTVIARPSGKPMTVGALGAAWRSACKEAGVVAQFRDIRAKAATDAKKGGQDYQTLLGHANPAMSERYIKRREAVIAEPVRRKL
jgi:integrase